jgi:hypothetical protein
MTTKLKLIIFAGVVGGMLGVSFMDGITRYVHHIGWTKYRSANVVEVAGKKEEFIFRDKQQQALLQYAKDKQAWDEEMSVRAHDKASFDENGDPIGTESFHQPDQPVILLPPQPPGPHIFPTVFPELDHCATIWSKDSLEKLHSEPYALIEFETHHQSNSNTDVTEDVPAWAETQFIATPQQTASLCNR